MELEHKRMPEGYINPRLVSDDGYEKRVYTAFHMLTRTWKILKAYREMPTEQSVNDELKPLLKELMHPNIVRVEPPQIVDGTIWMIEERLDGTFADYSPIRNQYTYAVWSSHISRALEFLHGRDIVHGDIHMRNCGIVGGVGKLLDFGQASYERGSRSSGNRGYISTRAPEQFAEKAPPASKQRDVWAFGCTLFAFRAGEYPFVTNDEVRDFREGVTPNLEQEVAARTENGMDGFPQRHRALFDDAGWSVLEQMIRPDPRKRATADALSIALDEYVATSERLTVIRDPEPGEVREAAQRILDSDDYASLGWFEDSVIAGGHQSRR
jgi:serine/threonine protein kinase